MFKRKGFVLQLVSFLTLTAILVGAIGGFASFTITSQMEKEIKSSNSEKMSSLMTILEQGYLIPITQLSDRIVNSNQLIYTKISSPTSLLALNGNLRENILRYPYLQNIGIYFIKSQVLVTAREIRYDLSNSTDQSFVNELLYEEELLKPKWFSRISGHGWSSSRPDVITYARRSSNLQSPEPFIIYISMYDSRVKEVLNSASSLSAHSIFILDKESRYISSNAKDIYDYTGRNFKNAVLQEKEKTENKNTVMSSCKSKITGFSYYLLSPRSLFFENALNIRNLVIIICASVALFGILLSILLSIRTYRPLKDAAKSLSSITGEKPSADEYKTIESAALHLKNKLKSEILNQILDGTLPYSREHEAKGILSHDFNVAAIIDAGFKEYDRIFNYCTQVFSNIPNSALVRKDHSLIVIMMSFNGEFTPVLSGLKDVLYGITEHLSVIAGIGAPCDSAIDLYVSYKQAKNARSYHFIAPQKSVFVFDELSSLPILPEYFSSNDFMRKFKSRNYEEISSGFGELRQALNEKLYNLPEIESLLFEIVSTINSTLPVGKEKRQLLQLYVRLFEYESIFDTIDQIEDKLKTLLNSSSDEALKSDMVKKIKDYIDKNYSEDLSLGFFSSKFYIAPSYISTLFKNTCGVCLSDYIFDVRMEHAREMLESKNAKIDEVALKCGYNNTSYFITRFKAKFGVSPNKYRTLFGYREI